MPCCQGSVSSPNDSASLVPGIIRVAIYYGIACAASVLATLLAPFHPSPLSFVPVLSYPTLPCERCEPLYEGSAQSKRAVSYEKGTILVNIDIIVVPHSRRTKHDVIGCGIFAS